jgi:hypothetical protein
MQVILSQDEIISALEQYVRNQISIKDGQTILIDLKAGRGENGFTANLDIQQNMKTPAVKALPENTISIDNSAFKIPSAEVLPMTPPAAQTEDEAAATSPSSIFSFSKTSNE